MASSSTYARSAERVERVCESVDDVLTLRIRLLAEIQRVVGFDAYAFLLTDPQTSVGCAPLADVPCLTELPALIRLKYLTEVNRWTTVRERSVARLFDATSGELARSRMWRELLAGYAVSDLLSSVFGDRFGCWGFLDLWRIGRGTRFSEAEADYLTRICPPVTAGLHRAQARTFADGGTRQPRVGPVVLLLTPDLRVRAQTPQTPAYLRTLVPPPPDRPPIPAGAYNVAAQLLAVEAGVDTNPPWARVHLAGGLWLTLNASRIGETAPPEERDITVTVEQSSPTERVDLFARAFALSARERQVTTYVVTGNDTRHIADRMFLSEHTIQDHLKSIFAKTDTHNRRSLVSHALGT